MTTLMTFYKTFLVRLISFFSRTSLHLANYVKENNASFEKIISYLVTQTGVRSCVSSPFSRCTPVLDWSE